MLEAGDEHGVECKYEWEYEDGGLWIGTVGAVEVLEWGEEAPCTTGASALVLDGRPGGVRDDDQARQGSEFQVNEDPEEEPAENGWWDLEMECPSIEDEVVGAPQNEPPHHRPYEASRPDHPTAAGEQRTRKKSKPLQISSGKKPGGMPGLDKYLAIVRAARTRTRTKNDTGDLPSQEDGCRSCTDPHST